MISTERFQPENQYTYNELVIPNDRGSAELILRTPDAPQQAT